MTRAMDERTAAISDRFSKSIFGDVKFEVVRARVNVRPGETHSAQVQFVDSAEGEEMAEDAIDVYDEDQRRLQATVELMIGLPDDLRYLLARLEKLEAAVVTT